MFLLLSLKNVCNISYFTHRELQIDPQAGESINLTWKSLTDFDIAGLFDEQPEAKGIERSLAAANYFSFSLAFGLYGVDDVGF